MKALVLAAGYATRLRPLTDDTAKPLLRLAGRPIIDYLCDRIDEADAVNELHVVSNARYAADFELWAQARRGRLRPLVHDDGSRSNATRLGAIADIHFVIEQARLHGKNLLVVAGDNLFEFSLETMIRFWRSKAGSSCVAVQHCHDVQRISSYGVVELSADGRVVDFVEKPEHPASDLIATAAYIYSGAHTPLIERYLDEGFSPDQPGNFLAWLYPRKPVYGFVFKEPWLDIGSPEQLREADRLLRRRIG
ncbi:MAG TPA: nucleotidyltransferase family protein [Gaiellaceae bacterium]|jgi:glucose-1-phosphate thymidylyltransferase